MTGNVKLYTGMTPSSLGGNQPHLTVGTGGANILPSQKKMVDKLHLPEFDQDKERVSSCERLCNIFNNHRN